MKPLYLLFILCLCHCSNDLHFSQNSEDRSVDHLASMPEDPPAFKCDDEEDCTITETFLMDKSEAAVDIIFVLDVSLSMKNNLKKLGSSMLDLLTHIQDFDWQMAFTTADHGDHVKSNGIISEQKWESYNGDQPHFGKFMKLEYRNKLLDDTILNSRNNFYETIFYDTLTINEKKPCSLSPFCQRDHEQPLRSLKAAIQRPENKEFFRSGSDLIAILITNEDERVEDPGNATTAKEVVQTFRSQFDNKKNLYGFGILIKDHDRRCYMNQTRKYSVEYGKKVGELARQTHGTNINICSSDYGKALKSVSQVIRNRVLDNVYLTKAFPKDNSVKVKITPRQNIEWKLAGRHIVFQPALALGSKVQVTYTPR